MPTQRAGKISFMMAAALFATALAAPARGGLLDPFVLFAIRGGTADLVQYDFDQQNYQSIGTIADDSGNVLGGIDAMGYVPGYLNLFAFRSDPPAHGQVQGAARLYYVNCITAEATAVGAPLGQGTITGATVALCDPNGRVLPLPAVAPDQATSPAVTQHMGLFAVQVQDNKVPIHGKININPNNSPDNQFIMKMDDGTVITWADLLGATMPASGPFCMGQAKVIKVKPKGIGNQRLLKVNNQWYVLENRNTHVFKGDDMRVVLMNDRVRNGRAMGQWYLGIHSIQATVSEYAGVDFDLDEGAVVPQDPFAAKVTILGAAITAGGWYDIPVTVKFQVGNRLFMPFGNPSLPVGANCNDANNPRYFVFPNTFAADTPISVSAQSWVKKRSRYAGNKNWHWRSYINASSTVNSPQVLLLRDGDPVPDIQPFMNQAQIEDFIGAYIDTAANTVRLAQNQAIYLFELGTTNLSSSAADFQDLVVLVTVGEDQDSLDPAPDNDTVGRLIKVDPKTAQVTELMPVSRSYDSLAADDNGVFHATFDLQLWRLDPAARTETLLGTMAQDQVKGSEFAGHFLCGFTVSTDRLVPIDAQSGAALGNPMNILAVDLTTIVFVRQPDLPALVGMD